MCRFKSALVLPSGEVFHDPATDAHEDLIRLAGIKRDTGREFVRVEFSSDKDLSDLDSYTLLVDETIVPDWYSSLDQEAIKGRLRDIVARCIVRDLRDILSGPCWIFGPGAGCKKLVSGRVLWAQAANLSGANLSEADLSRADLFEANLSMANLSRANLSGAIVSESCKENLRARGAIGL